jgi:carnitine-CoA ligase
MSTFVSLLEERCQERKDATFLVTRDSSLTYREFDRRTKALAVSLVERGVVKGDPVALLMRNHIEFVISWFAVLRAGAVIVPLNTELRGEHLDYMFATADARTLIVDSDLLPAISNDLTGLTLMVVNGKHVEGSRTSNAVVEYLADLSTPKGGSDVVLPEVSGEDPCQMMFSSGTTGRPRAVLRYHRNEVKKSSLADACNLTQDDVLYSNVPLFHGLGLNWVQMALWSGASIALVPRFSVSRFIEDVRHFGATAATHVGSMVSALMQTPPKDSDRSAGLRVSFGIGVPIDLWKSYEERFGLSVIEFYGSTETGLVAINEAGGPIGSLGRPVEGVEVRLVGRDGRDVARGDAGEMFIRFRDGVRTLPAFYKEPEATADRVKDGWWRTGDLVREDASGNLFFIGRARDTIRHRGENIVPEDIERTVNRHPAVATSIAVAMPGSLGEDDVRLFVVPASDMSLNVDELEQWLASELPRFMQPTLIEQISELPLTATHKVKREELRLRPLPGSEDRKANVESEGMR